MSKFAAYNIDLKALGQGKHSYTYTLDDVYFAKIDSAEVQRGEVMAEVDVVVSAAGYDVRFKVEGHVIIACDRCLDDMQQAIKADDRLRIRLGDELADDGEVMVLPERDPVLNVAWFLYELIALSIPANSFTTLSNNAADDPNNALDLAVIMRPSGNSIAAAASAKDCSLRSRAATVDLR